MCRVENRVDRELWWDAERCWHQIKADCDVDKSVRDRQKLLTSAPRPL